MDSSQKKIAQYLQDALVLEGTLRRSLIAHIAVSPRDRHRELLEEHLRVTIAQERRLAERLAELRGRPGVLASAVGVAKASAALGLTLLKGPADALRGTNGDDVALRNVQDESASEALEIAVYDTIEALALQLGDLTTAVLAREHRAQEEAFLAQLRQTVPELARNAAERGAGGRTFPWSTVGVLDAGRVLIAGARTAWDRAEAPPAPFVVAPDATPKANTADAPARPKAAAANRAAGRPGQPIGEYDDMSPVEITDLLDHLPAESLDAVETYERAHDQRAQVLSAIEDLRASRSGARS